MIEIISKKEISGIKLDALKEEISALETPKNLIIDYKNNRVASISFYKADQFLIDGKLIDGKIKDWFREEDPYYDGDCYIFPEKNIAVSLENENDDYEVTLYSDLVKSLYEKDLNKMPRFSDIENQKVKTLGPMVFLPYAGLGPFKFGDNIEQVKAIMGQPHTIGSKLRDVEIMYYNNTSSELVFRFDAGQLSQITFQNPRNVYFEKLDISSKSQLANLFDRYEWVKSNAYRIFKQLGMVVSGCEKTNESLEFFFCTEKIQKNWENTKRPITSW